jgi:hypothetical protein
MSEFEKLIRNRLVTKLPENKKQVGLFLNPKDIKRLEAIAGAMTNVTGIQNTRNMLIEDAIRAYLDEAESILKKEGIHLNGFVDTDADKYDTVVFPGYKEGFWHCFIGENEWHYVRVKKERIPKLKYIAIYIGAPVSQITHYAPIAEGEKGFEYDVEKKKYIVHFSGPAIELENPIPLGSTLPTATRAPRYTTLERLLTATEYKDLG